MNHRRSKHIAGASTHDGASRSELIFASARQHALISDNPPARTDYFDSNITQTENARES